MNQLHIACDISIRSGGLGLAALRYAQAISKAGSKVTLFVANRTSDELDFTNEDDFNLVSPILISNSFFFIKIYYQIKFLNSFMDQEKYDLIHIHGTWSPILAFAAFLANFKSIPYFVSPHGCLESWALKHRGIKKKLALLVYQRHIFNKASMLIATAEQELQSIRSLGISGLVAIIPNGVDFEEGEKKWHSSKDRKFLFLSRIHPVKGLRDLVYAWSRARQHGWKIVIAGPSELGHVDEIKALTQRLEISQDFEFPGLVSGKEKEKCFSDADIFVLPTYSENFGIAVAEALARGLPVITTTGAPWHDLESYKCGWWVRPGVEGVAAALSEAMSMKRDNLIEMGQRGQKLIKEKYSWDLIGKVALRTSNWMLNRIGEKPENIYKNN